VRARARGRRAAPAAVRRAHLRPPTTGAPLSAPWHAGATSLQTPPPCSRRLPPKARPSPPFFRGRPPAGSPSLSPELAEPGSPQAVAAVRRQAGPAPRRFSRRRKKREVAGGMIRPLGTGNGRCQGAAQIGDRDLKGTHVQQSISHQTGAWQDPRQARHLPLRHQPDNPRAPGPSLITTSNRS